MISQEIFNKKKRFYENLDNFFDFLAKELPKGALRTTIVDMTANLREETKFSKFYDNKIKKILVRISNLLYSSLDELLVDKSEKARIFAERCYKLLDEMEKELR